MSRSLERASGGAGACRTRRSGALATAAVCLVALGPGSIARAEPPPSHWLLAPDFAERAREVRVQQRLRVEDVPLEAPGAPVPGGGVLPGDSEPSVGTLDLRRIDVFARDASLLVHRGGRDHAVDAPDTAYFVGEVEGRPGSFAFLAVDGRRRTRGLVSDGDGTWKIVTEEATPSVARLDTNEPFGAAGAAWSCDNDGKLELAPGEEELAAPLSNSYAGSAAPSPDGLATTSAVSTTYVAQIAVETDAEFHALFASTQEAMDYVGDLFAAISAIYERDVGTVVQIGYLSLWPDGPDSDPWVATSTSAGLTEFLEAWTADHGDVPRTVAHFLSGKNTGSGAAYVGVLCSTSFGYGFTGGIDGAFSTTDPGLFWDIMAVSHEIGHNFGSGHTHCYVPPVDQCYGGQSACYSGPTSVPANGGGSIMSYCHLESGGYSNISLWFGRQDYYGVESMRVPQLMRAQVEAAWCMEEFVPPPVVGLTATPAAIVAGDTSRLDWTSTGADGCEFVQGIAGPAATSGTLDVSPPATRTFAISCTGPGGTAVAEAEVAVSRPETTLSLAGATLSIVGPTNARTRLTVRHRVRTGGESVEIRERKGDLVIGAGMPCVAVRKKVVCSGTFDGIAIWLGQARDRASVHGTLPVFMNGGGGRDVLRGGDGGDTLQGGSEGDRLIGRGGADLLQGDDGDDRLDGGPGDDLLEGGGGADVLIGRSGTDTAVYTGRAGTVDVTYDDVANDGEVGEGDNVRSSVELQG